MSNLKGDFSELKKALEAKGFTGKLMTPEVYKAMLLEQGIKETKKN